MFSKEESSPTTICSLLSAHVNIISTYYVVNGVPVPQSSFYGDEKCQGDQKDERPSKWMRENWESHLI